MYTVKQLKELLNTLPDDAVVIVSEKFGRGGPMQDYIIGKVDDSYTYVEQVDTYEHLEEMIQDCEEMIDLAKRGEYTISPDGFAWEFVLSSKKSIRQMYMTDKDVDYFIPKVQKTIDKIKKDIERRKNDTQPVNAIEISCGF